MEPRKIAQQYTLREYAHQRGFHAFRMSTEKSLSGGSFGFDTPEGTYAYPLNPSTYERWFSGGTPIPFGGDRPWILILRASTDDILRFNEDGSSNLTDVEGLVNRTARDWEDLTLEMMWELAEREDEQAKWGRDRLRFEDGEIPFTESHQWMRYVKEFTNTPSENYWRFTGLLAHLGGNGAGDWSDILLLKS